MHATKTPTRKGWAPLSKFARSYALPDGTQHAIVTYDDFDFIEAEWAKYLGSKVEAESHEAIEHRGGKASTAGHTFLPIEDADDVAYAAWLSFTAQADAEAIADDAHAAAYAARRPAQSQRVTEDGMYRKDGQIFKVQRAVNGSGNLYAKILYVERGTGRFEYAPGAITSLTPADKMTLAEAQEFGHLYGVCCVCGRTLTDERSIADGIGPVCSGKGFRA